MDPSETPELQAMIESWLLGNESHSSPAEASGWKAETSVPPSSPSSWSRITTPSVDNNRGRKRRREMSDPSIISRRPILTPRGPSQHSRSRSPVRALRALLAAATPAVHFMGIHQTILPEYVLKLKEKLMQGGEKGVIAEQLKDRIKAIAPIEFNQIVESRFDKSDDTPAAKLDQLWVSVQDIHTAAETCQRYQKDESAWVDVVRKVLNAAKLHFGLDMLEVNSIQTQSIDSRYLPILANSRTPFHKKADLAYFFTPDHTEVAKLRKKMGLTSLSQMTDPYTQIIPMACGIEVKGAGGNVEEAIVQYGIWATAGLANVNELFDGAILLQPLLGWTVVGHEWNLHMSWKLENGEVIVCGPWRNFHITTDTYEGIFQLLHFIGQVGQWLQEDYWAWFSEGIVVVE